MAAAAAMDAWVLGCTRRLHYAWIVAGVTFVTLLAPALSSRRSVTV